MNANKTPNNPSGQSLDSCSVVILYSDHQTRTRAMAACNYLMDQLWEDIELAFHWWRVDFLREPELATAAARHATKADFLIVCLNESTRISPLIPIWFDSWIDQRQGRNGALIDLHTSVTKHGSETAEKLLAEACRRGNFDYLKALPLENPEKTTPQSPTALPQSGPNYGERPSYSHYGLNE